MDEEDLGDEDLIDEGPLLTDDDITYEDFDDDEIDPGSDGRY